MEKIIVNGVERILETGDELFLTIAQEGEEVVELTANKFVQLCRNAKFGVRTKQALLFTGSAVVGCLVTWVIIKLIKTCKKKVVEEPLFEDENQTRIIDFMDSEEEA